jgi:hypothetical protein
LLADGHVKFLLPGQVSPGIPATAQANAANATGSLEAEGTQNGTHAATFSPT